MDARLQMTVIAGMRQPFVTEMGRCARQVFYGAVIALCSTFAGVTQAVTVTERELIEGIDPIGRHPLYAADTRGPMVLDVPTNICMQQVPDMTGIPASFPLEDRTAPDYKLKVATEAKHYQMRFLQGIYCRSVFDDKYAKALRPVLPAACFQPPERAGLVNPAHFLADRNRSDVLEAERVHLEAVGRIRELRRTCEEAAASHY